MTNEADAVPEKREAPGAAFAERGPVLEVGQDPWRRCWPSAVSRMLLMSRCSATKSTASTRSGVDSRLGVLLVSVASMKERYFWEARRPLANVAAAGFICAHAEQSAVFGAIESVTWRSRQHGHRLVSRRPEWRPETMSGVALVAFDMTGPPVVRIESHGRTRSVFSFGGGPHHWRDTAVSAPLFLEEVGGPRVTDEPPHHLVLVEPALRCESR